jgi:myo-inositol 2-dehydrogenase / D-chiro-inositol 1-dehydrogenase
MTDPNSPKASSATRRDFLRTSTAATATLGLGLLNNAHAAGSDAIKVGLVGCGGRGTGAAENICEAAGTSYNIKLHALGDVFDDHLRNCRDSLKGNSHCKEKFDVSDDRCFLGFDAYQKVIECCDLVMLATPPGFRPLHIEAVVKAGKHLFTEKPVAVDGPGIRKVLAAYEESKKKDISIVAGTQRRHQAGYVESLKRIHPGALGEIITARVFWNGGGIWVHNREQGWGDTEYQIRNWYHFLWLCGDHFVEQHVHNLDVALWALGHHPVKCVGMGGRQMAEEPARGQSYDHFAVDYEFPGDIHVMSTARQIDGCANNVSEYIVGTRGVAHLEPGNYRFQGLGSTRLRVPNEVNPYVQEHIDLLESITSRKPINELKQVATSTLTAIMGRESAYTGKEVTWDQALNSKRDTFPNEPLVLSGPMKEGALPRPGSYELI